MGDGKHGYAGHPKVPGHPPVQCRVSMSGSAAHGPTTPPRGRNCDARNCGATNQCTQPPMVQPISCGRLHPRRMFVRAQHYSAATQTQRCHAFMLSLRHSCMPHPHPAACGGFASQKHAALPESQSIMWRRAKEEGVKGQWRLSFCAPYLTDGVINLKPCNPQGPIDTAPATACPLLSDQTGA